MYKVGMSVLRRTDDPTWWEHLRIQSAFHFEGENYIRLVDKSGRVGVQSTVNDFLTRVEDKTIIPLPQLDISCA